MKLIALVFQFTAALKQLTLIECGKCYQLIRINYPNHELVYHCKVAIVSGRCEAYKRAYGDTSIYF